MMDPFLILAMVVAGVVTHVWEQSKRRSAAAWAQAQQHAATRAQARTARVTARTSRLRTARAAGPRDPLWWPYALGWVAAGVVRAGHAGVQGAREGATAGAREGRRFGHAAARRGWTLRRTWQEYRRRRAAAAPTGPTAAAADGADELIVEECPACGVYVPHLVGDRELGRVCGPCADWRAAGDEPAGAARHEPPAHACDGTCTSSDVDPAEAERRGLCPDCGGPGEYVWNFGDEHGHTPCPTCNPGGQGHKRPRVYRPGEAPTVDLLVGDGHDPRCSGGVINGHRGYPDCMEELRRGGHTGSDQQLDALLIDRWAAAEARGCDYNVPLDYGSTTCGDLVVGKWHEDDDEHFCAAHMGDPTAAAKKAICPRCFVPYDPDDVPPVCGSCDLIIVRPAERDLDDDTREAYLITAPDGHRFVSLIGPGAYEGVPGCGVEPVVGVERRDGFQITTSNGGITMTAPQALGRH